MNDISFSQNKSTTCVQFLVDMSMLGDHLPEISSFPGSHFFVYIL